MVDFLDGAEGRVGVEVDAEFACDDVDTDFVVGTVVVVVIGDFGVMLGT